MKFLVYVSGLLLIAYNLHAGLMAQEIGFFGLDIKFVKVGDTVKAEPVVGPPVILRTTESSSAAKVTITPTPGPTSPPRSPTTVSKPTTVPTIRPSDLCVQGFVWREAVTGDHVCVTPATIDQAAADNLRAAARRSSTGGNFGVDTCLAGFVWREATPIDHVCVTPMTRDQTATDNRLAQSRMQR